MALDVKFTDDIPKISREGFNRKSKYDPILDACVERVGKAAHITVETQGQASSRASSIKAAAETHQAVTEGKGHFTVATRSGENEDEYHVFVKYEEGPAPEEKTGSVGKTKKTKSKSKAA